MVIWIDPGKDGGICIIGEEIILHRMPKWTYKEIFDWLRSILLWYKWPVYTEDVHAIYGSAAKSTFNFWKVLWVTLSACWSLWLEVHQIQPKKRQGAVWVQEDIVKKENGRKDTKQCSLNASMRLYPDVSCVPERCSKPHDWLVDALLIAHYGNEVHKMM